MSTKKNDELKSVYEAHTRQIIRAGYACASCGATDKLYSDQHGTFCSRCGPSVPLQRTTLTWSGSRTGYGL